MAHGVEADRLVEARAGVPWKRWGPYLSERQWGTVREDYSDNGDAWSYFTHDQAPLARLQVGRGRHRRLLRRPPAAVLRHRAVERRRPDPEGADVRADQRRGQPRRGREGVLLLPRRHADELVPASTGTAIRSAEYPYDDLVATNRDAAADEFEYELLDTGVFDDDRYVDVDVEYAKAAPEDVHVRITLANRGAEPATVHLLPSLWFRNTWWMGEPKGALHAPQRRRPRRDRRRPPRAGRRSSCAATATPCCCSPRTRPTRERLWGAPNAVAVRQGRVPRVRRARARRRGQPGPHRARRRRRTTSSTSRRGDRGPCTCGCARRARRRLDGAAADELFAAADRRGRRVLRLDHAAVTTAPDEAPGDAPGARRDAVGQAALLASTSTAGSSEHHVPPAARRRRHADVRNRSWFHMVNDDVISMPDTWEYPWYASWDLAFHTVALAMVDVDFAKAQLELMLRELYLHPSGQLPAYEWNFSDVNPPVHAWATLLVYETELEQRGAGDVDWLKRARSRSCSSTSRGGSTARTRPGATCSRAGSSASTTSACSTAARRCPTGGHLEQSDGTAWMAFFSQCMLGIAVELSQHDPLVRGHGAQVRRALRVHRRGDGPHRRQPATRCGTRRTGSSTTCCACPTGAAQRLKVRSMVGLLPLCATTILPRRGRPDQRRPASRGCAAGSRRCPSCSRRSTTPREPGVNGRRMLAMLDETKLRRVLARMLDEDEFLSPHGLRALSRVPRRPPVLASTSTGRRTRSRYLPAESDSGMFGGNSNWRGPVWFPVNYLRPARAAPPLRLLRRRRSRSSARPGRARQCTLFEVATELGRRLASIFVPDGDGRRPVYGGTERFQTDPNWKDLLLFYEYFHGDNGAGLGASHQTGWTGLVARIIQVLGYLRPEDLLVGGARGPPRVRTGTDDERHERRGRQRPGRSTS